MASIIFNLFSKLSEFSYVRSKQNFNLHESFSSYCLPFQFEIALEKEYFNELLQHVFKCGKYKINDLYFHLGLMERATELEQDHRKTLSHFQAYDLVLCNLHYFGLVATYYGNLQVLP